MRAMILAAGLGTRLRPLTYVRPKALVPLLGTVMLDYLVERLSWEGVEAVAVNAFHLHGKLVDAVERNAWPIPVHVALEPTLLGTGGGIRNVLDFFEGEPFIVVNGDVVCDAPLRELYRLHVESGSPVSLLLHDYPRFNNVAVDGSDCVRGFGKDAGLLCSRNGDLRLPAFTGVHFINPQVLKDLPVGEPVDILSVYRQLIGIGTPPRALFSPGLFWGEMGSIEGYRELTRELCSTKKPGLLPFATGNRLQIHPRARVEEGVEMNGFVVIGKDSFVSAGAELEDVVLWDGVRVGRECRLKNCIVADGVAVEGVRCDEIITE